MADAHDDKRHEDALVELYAKASADHFKDCHGCGGGAHKAGLLAVFASAASHARENGDDPMEFERAVSRAATVIGQSPLIDKPKLPPACWEGLARQVLEAAAFTPSTTPRIAAARQAVAELREKLKPRIPTFDECADAIATALCVPSATPHSVALAARRYERLRILGCAPMDTGHLERGEVMRFTNLDEWLDHDLMMHPSRGEANNRPDGGKQT